MHTSKQSAAALLICAAFVFTVLFSFLFIIDEAEHDCTDSSCPVCVSIHLAEQLVRTLGSGRTAAGAVCFAALTGTVCVLVRVCASVGGNSLITSKMRLNN